MDQSEAMREIVSHRNAGLEELSENAPTVAIFLGHTGCTFCREPLAQRQETLDEVVAALFPRQCDATHKLPSYIGAYHRTGKS
jgi:hypothetical protein